MHVHALVLDGVYARGPSGELCFHPADPFTARDVDDVLATVEAYIGRVLARRRWTSEDGDEGGWHSEAPLLAGLAAASVQGAVAFGAARRLRMAVAADREGEDEACRARSRGFDLHAGLWIPAGQRDRLERVCQYVLHPPVATERVTLTETGQVRLTLRRPWSDGTTHLEFEPVAFLERLAVLVPRPRVNLLLYYGVLAPRAAWRRAIVPNAGGDQCPSTSASESDASEAEAPPSARGYRWAELLRRTFRLRRDSGGPPKRSRRRSTSTSSPVRGAAGVLC